MFTRFKQDMYEAFDNHKNSLPVKNKRMSNVDICVCLKQTWTHLEHLFKEKQIQVDLPKHRDIFLKLSENELQLLMLNQLFLIYENLLGHNTLHIQIKETKDNVSLIFTSHGQHNSYDLNLKQSLRKWLSLYKNFHIVNSYHGQISFTGLAKESQCQFVIVFPK